MSLWAAVGGRGGVGGGGGLAPEDRDRSLRSLNWRLLIRIFHYTRPYAKKRNLLFLVTGLRALQKPAVGWAIGAVISGPIAGGNWAATLWGAAGFALLAASTEFLFHFRQRWQLEIGEAVVHDLRRDLFGHVQQMPMSFFHEMTLGGLLSRVISDINNIRRGVQHVFFFSILMFGQMFISGAIMLYLNPVLFCILLLLGPTIFGISRYFHRRMSRASREAQRRHSRVTSTIAESVLGMREIQGYVRETTNAQAFSDRVDAYADSSLDLHKNAAVYTPILDFNAQIFLALLLGAGGYGVLGGHFGLNLGDLISFFFLANIFFQPFQSMGRLYTSAIVSMAGAERIFRLIDRDPSWTDAPDARPMPRIRGDLAFDGVSFGYDPETPVIHDLSFEAGAGQSIALVGHTGSGKSTLVNLIAKFYQPQQGRILIDGIDLDTVTQPSLRSQMGLVLQTHFLFTGTVLQNIQVGQPDATREDVRAAARELDCLDLLEALPDGLDTEVGEQGKSLSLGQRQIIAFVRALLANPRIVLLDEATSAIDTLTEARIQTALNKLLTGRTSVIVAHRLSTIRHADQVLVLDHGRLIERGNHRELLEQGGAYADLYRQFIAATAA
ncbi:MAG: ABC transporter ATP-binding protein [Opitutales bacterium]